MSEPKRRLGDLLETSPRSLRAEAIAMRRIIIEAGAWLSPFMRGAPLPVLTEWERTVDLSRLEGNQSGRHREARRMNREQTSLELLERLDSKTKQDRSGRTSQYKVQSESELREIEVAKSKARRNPAHRAKTPATIKHDPEVAIARIASVAALKAEAEAAAVAKTEAEQAERRREVCRQAQGRYAAKISADPERKAIEDAKRRERERALARKRGVKPRAKGEA
jgi:hypothetical protein